MDERRAYQRLKKIYPQAHWQRIENSVGTGCPDVNGCWRGVEAWIELKEGKLLKNGLVKVRIRPAQRAWAAQRLRVFGNAWLIVLVNQNMFLLPGTWIKDSRWETTGLPLAELARQALPTDALFERPVF